MGSSGYSRWGESRLEEKKTRKRREEEEPRVKHAALPDGDYDDAMTQGSPRQPHMYGDRNVTARNAVQSANGPFHLIWTATHLGASRPSRSTLFGCTRGRGRGRGRGTSHILSLWPVVVSS